MALTRLQRQAEQLRKLQQMSTNKKQKRTKAAEPTQVSNPLFLRNTKILHQFACQQCDLQGLWGV